MYPRFQGDPISIGKLERFVADWARENGIKPTPAAQKNGKKVAVIGSGPAGLTCAGDLAKWVMMSPSSRHCMSRRCTGIRYSGVPSSQERRCGKEIENVKSLGVHIETNVVVGKSVTIDQLMDEEGFQACIHRFRCRLPKFMGIPGENATVSSLPTST